MAALPRERGGNLRFKLPKLKRNKYVKKRNQDASLTLEYISTLQVDVK